MAESESDSGWRNQSRDLDGGVGLSEAESESDSKWRNRRIIRGWPLRLLYSASILVMSMAAGLQPEVSLEEAFNE